MGERIADAVARALSSFRAFLVAFLIVLVWAALGPHFDYSDTWQLVINTGTTIATFLTGFLILLSQSRQEARLERIALDTERRIETLQVEIARLEIEKLDAILARQPTVENLLRALDRSRRAPTRRGEHPMWRNLDPAK